MFDLEDGQQGWLGYAGYCMDTRVKSRIKGGHRIMYRDPTMSSSRVLI